MYRSFTEFANDNSKTIFRYWIYRRGFTPYEQEGKFLDESMFEDIHCRCAYIHDVIFLPDDDILIGFLDSDCANDPEAKNNIQYCKLSEIRLELYEGDQENDSATLTLAQTP